MGFYTADDRKLNIFLLSLRGAFCRSNPLSTYHQGIASLHSVSLAMT
jgi:hypothetical protein